MSFISFVLAIVAITPLLVHIISSLFMWLLAVLSFINNLLLATVTLMWILLQILLTWLQSIFYVALSLFNTLLTLVWSGLKIPFVKLVTFLYKLGSALLGITQLTLCIVYYGLVLWISCYCIILIYRFLQRCDFAIQGEFYFGPSPLNPNFGGGSQHTLTIAPVILEEGRPPKHYLMAPKQKNSTTSGTSKPRTRGQKAQDVLPPVKKTRLVSATALLTRIINQQVCSNSDQTGTVSGTMAQQLKRPAKNNKIPSSSSTSVGANASCSPRWPVQPTGAQHPSFPSPTPEMEQPMAKLPTAWWGPWGPPPPWASFKPTGQGFYNNWQQLGQGHTPGPNNSNSHLRFHQHLQCNNRSVNN